jgi:hypothetical protein
MKARTSLLLAVILISLTSTSFAAMKVAIMYDDADVNYLRNGVLQYKRDCGQIDLIPLNFSPSPALIAHYDAVIVTSPHTPIYYFKSWGNVIADYAKAGGGVVLGFASLSTAGPHLDYGRLEDPLYAPFARGPIVAGDDTLGNILLPSNPIMDGVDELTTHYRYGVTVNAGATLVASFSSGIPLAGFKDVGSGRVVGIQADYQLNPYFTNEGDYMQLYRNAVVYSATPEPATLLMLGLGGLLLRRRIRGERLEV